MELVTLDSTEGSSTLFQPMKLIENYESLIWTERYWSCGDFELTSTDISGAMKQLPLESYVSLRESTVPMIIESYKISEPKGKAKSITIKGRSLESVLERRASVFTLTPQATDPTQSTPPRRLQRLWGDKQSDVAYKAMRMVLGDIARSNLPAANPVNPADRIPELNLPLPTDYSTGTSTEYEVKAGNLYTVVLELLEANRHGIRAIRPPAAAAKTTVDLEIYNGADLRESAVFDARFDEFDDATYLLSYQGSTNVAYIYGPNGASSRNKNTGPEPSGLNRRVLLVDEMGNAALNSDAVRQNRGLVELYKNNAIAVFEGEITEATSLFNKPIAEGGYGLGDIVSFNANHGLTRPMRVAEFIRTSDTSGEKAYPAFQVIDE